MPLPRLTRAVAVAAVVLALAACGGIPTSGGVAAGPRFGEEPAVDTIFNPLGPIEGADQRSILAGFIAAFTGTQSDYAKAREFLSQDFKKEWDPRKSVLIRSGPPTFTSLDENTMEYAFSTTAQLDEFGAYSMAAEATQRLTFEFVKEDDQWRISQAPDGIVLPESTFLTIFSKHALYFYDLSLRHLVPDQRWFPGGTTATRVVTALLAGPPEWLQGAVVTQFPDGTQLTPGTTVTIDSTVAQVDLTSEAAAADENQRRLMQLQLTESLGTVSGIGSVELSVSGTLLTIEPFGSDQPVAQSPVDQRPLVLADGQFGYYSSGAITPVDDLSEKIVGLSPAAVVLGSRGTAAAVLAADGVYAVRAGEDAPLRVDERSGLVAPSLDDYGYVWSVPAASPSAFVAFGPDGAAHPVAVTLPPDTRVRSFAVSRDNARIAILLQTPVGARLVVAAIARDAGQDYLPTGIGAPVISSLLDDASAVGVTWVDAFSVAVLADTDDVDLVTSFEVGGQRSSLGRAESPAVTIVGGSSKSGLRLLGADGFLQSPRGSGWQKTGVEVELLATQR
jgi:hypothetical protein